MTGSSGHKWNAVEGGEGYSPLECHLNGISAEDLDRIASVDLVLKDAEVLRTAQEATRRHWHQVSGGRGGKGFSNVTGIARAEWFKRKDPWYA
jgi:hypothetical protein